MTISYEEAKKIFDELVATHDGAILQSSNQMDFVRRVNHTFRFKLFSKPFQFSLKNRLDSNGICYAAVCEWYRYHGMGLGRNIISDINSLQINSDVVNRINFLHSDMQKATVEMGDDLVKKKSYKLSSIELAFLQNIDIYNVEKTYGLSCLSCHIQTNWMDNFHLKSNYGYSEKKEEEIDVNQGIASNFSLDTDDFDKVIDESIKLDSIESFQQIFLCYYNSYGKMEGHCVGLWCNEAAGENSYLFYDPNFGEVKFTSSEGCIQFLKDYCRFYYECFSTRIESKQVFVKTFSDERYPQKNLNDSNKEKIDNTPSSRYEL